ncbi:MAG TPA: hypothetical protein VFO40_17130 [Chthoniobacterales bacterium]|nr:hypothetical protein [Chthoniobacterales bacterium]
MKICYCDESGTGNEPIAVTVGVVVDSQRMRVSKEDWKELLAQLSNMIGSKIDELHTRDFYSGNSPFRNLNGSQRSDYISAIFKWFVDRKHHFFTQRSTKLFLESLRAVYRFRDATLIAEKRDDLGNALQNLYRERERAGV